MGEAITRLLVAVIFNLNNAREVDYDWQAAIKPCRKPSDDRLTIARAVNHTSVAGDCNSLRPIAVRLKLFQTVKRPLGMRNKFIAEYVGMIEFCSASIPQERIHNMIQAKTQGRACVCALTCVVVLSFLPGDIPDEILF